MDHLIRTLWRQSHAIGPWPSVIIVIGWVALGGALTFFGFPLLAPYPVLFWAFLSMVSAIFALGAIVGFWILMSHLAFNKCGYQLQWLTGNEWAYEERQTDGSIDRLSLTREIVGGGYPAPSDVFVQSAATWDQKTPMWARGRRSEILGRIAGQFGGRVQFHDVNERLSAQDAPGPH